MAVRCSAKQVADAVIIRSANNFSSAALCIELEDVEKMKSLDLFLSTLDVFRDAFSTIIEKSFLGSKDTTFLSKPNFIEYLRPRALFLTKKNGHFDCMLTCAYASTLIKYRAVNHRCFHFANVASKLLTSVLSKKFKEVFATDSDWEKLMSYSKNIHAAVFPSKLNRPSWYKPLPEDGSDDYEGKREESHESIYLGGASNIQLDETTYWSYFKMGDQTLRERITDTKMHLKEVTNAFVRLKTDMDSKLGISDEYNIPVSDDEYIDHLKRENAGLSYYTEPEIRICPVVKDCFAREICEKQNAKIGGNSWQNRIEPLDIPREEVQEHISSMWKKAVEEENFLKCDLCDGKMQSFIKNWKERFHREYLNSDSVTDVI